MSATPSFASTIVAAAVSLTTGDTSRTAPSTTGTIFAPGVNGGLVERINICPTATTVASVIRFFRYDGSSYHLLFEIALPAQTLAAGTPVVDIVLSAVNFPDRFPIAIPAAGSAWSLRASVNDTQTGVQVQAEGGGF